jgi:hypothetical protein
LVFVFVVWPADVGKAFDDGTLDYNPVLDSDETSEKPNE